MWCYGRPRPRSTTKRMIGCYCRSDYNGRYWHTKIAGWLSWLERNRCNIFNLCFYSCSNRVVCVRSLFKCCLRVPPCFSLNVLHWPPIEFICQKSELRIRWQTWLSCCWKRCFDRRKSGSINDWLKVGGPIPILSIYVIDNILMQLNARFQDTNKLLSLQLADVIIFKKYSCTFPENAFNKLKSTYSNIFYDIN